MNFSFKIICLVLLGFLFLSSCYKDKEEQTAESSKGSVVFWTPNLAAHGGYVDVTINGLTREITANWLTPPPSCLSTNGVAYFYLDAGTHSYSTIDFFGFTSTGTVTIAGTDCNKKRIE